jgi:hypothetical protein
VGFEPTISAGERPQTYALDRAASGTGTIIIITTTTTNTTLIIITFFTTTTTTTAVHNKVN